MVMYEWMNDPGEKNCSFFGLMSDFQTSDQNWLQELQAGTFFRQRGDIPQPLGLASKADCSGWWTAWQFPPWKWCFFILFLFVFGSDTWKASQIRSRLECQHFRALSFNTWRRHNNCKKVCGGRFSFFRGIMVLVLALSIFYCHFSLLIAYFSTCWENNMKRMVRKVKWEP